MSNYNNNKEEFKPYVPAEKIMPEMTITTIVMGVILAVIFAAANAYLGLRIGMTVAASIPAAVISMGILRGIFKRDSILENNVVQTIASAGEAVAGGAIFTLPVLFLWSKQWNTAAPSILLITTVCLAGGILGALFMIPLRTALIVKEHGILPYPEGTACAEVLKAGEQGGAKAKITFFGVGIGALYKFLGDGLMLFPTEIERSFKSYRGSAIGMDILPALLGVGFIIGPEIAAYMFAGAVMGWFALMPLIAFIGDQAPTLILYPGTDPISQMDHWKIWSTYLRYVGAGAVAFGGIFSLIKSIPLIVSSFKDAVKGIGASGSIKRTEKDLSGKFILIGSLVVILVLGMLPFVKVGILGALIIAICGFFFATVSSRIVGMVGSSNSPASGMTIATLLITAFVFKATGHDGQAGMMAVLIVGAIICVIVAIAGDTSQDLKTGYLVGATPKYQEIGLIIGVVASALVVGGILVLLDKAWGFGSKEISAPQANLMKIVIEGVMGGTLPWPLVFVGAGIGAALACLGLPVLPIALGLYLPIHLSTPIVVGGLIKHILDRQLKKPNANVAEITEKTDTGILFASGLIAGEGLVGILLAILAVAQININIGNGVLGQLGGLVVFILLILVLMKYSVWFKVDPKNKRFDD